MMRSIYMVMNIHIYGTFEKESQWRGARFPADIYIPYIHICMYIYISQILTDAKFNLESDGMNYLASPGHALTYICEKRQK